MSQGPRDDSNPTDQTPNRKPFPKPDEIYLTLPLYRAVDILPTDVAAFREFEGFTGKLNAYCVQCGIDRTFDRHDSPPTIRVPDHRAVGIASKRRPLGDLSDREITAEFECTWDGDHRMFFYFLLTSSKLIKVGQYPSRADLDKPTIARYKGVLGEQRLSELNKAVGLNAHGIGIGSYVYLRRIFEGLVDEAHTAASDDTGWDEEAYERSRMDEKIQLLKNHLPSMLVTNRSIYGILSKGIHELSEQECQLYFPMIKLGIETILDEKIREEEEQKKRSIATQEIARISGQIKG